MSDKIHAFNFTKNSYIDTYLDATNKHQLGLEEPKIKGFFVTLLVKPDLNLILSDEEMSDQRSNSRIANSYGLEYSEKMWHLKLFKGLLNPYIKDNLTHQGGLYFSPIIANKSESISYPDLGSNSEETLTTLDKGIFKLPVTETGFSGMSFSLRLRENEALDALRMISVWHKYIHAVTRGNIRPDDDYVEYNIIDYKASLYVLHLKPDFKTITMWSKFTGIYPVNVPLSAFSEEISQLQDISIDIEFSYDKFEWLDEDLLKEINLLTSGVPVTRANIAQNPKGIAELMKKSNIKMPLIQKINGTPFYQLDFNGLQHRLSGKAVTLGQQPVGLFGASEHAKGAAYFPAPLNTEMINASTSFSITEQKGNRITPITKISNRKRG